jgi:hypothetical protein
VINKFFDAQSYYLFGQKCRGCKENGDFKLPEGKNNRVDFEKLTDPMMANVFLQEP